MLTSGYGRSGQVGTDWVKSCKFRSRSSQDQVKIRLGQIKSDQDHLRSGKDNVRSR